ncbi:MAG: porin family protein [Taibaiella sp.]|jgi:hypothetical protein
MKKLILLLLAASAITTTFAQRESRSPLRFGLKAGANISHLNVSDNYGSATEKNSFGIGAFGGGLLEISGPAGSKFKGQVEALFNWHNFKNTYTDPGFTTKDKISLSQISVPIMLKYFVIPSLSINAGPSVNFNIAAKDKYEINTAGVIVKYEDDIKEADALQTIQIGALVGATYYIYEGFFVDARYNYYFGSMAKDLTPDYKFATSAIQIGVGYKF